jgi:two-component system cell cycle sensor histidine kinase/response regulator CckA
MGVSRQGTENSETVEVARLPVPAYVWKQVDGVLTLVDCNDAARTIEPAMDEMLGMTADQVEASGPAIGEGLRRALEDQTVVSAEGAYQRRADGSVRWLAATYVYAPPATVIVHVEDVTERRREERLLRESNERFRGAFESSPLGKALVSLSPDDAGRLIEVNDAFCELFGYPRERLLGQLAPAELSHPDDLDAGLRQIARLAAGEVDSCHFESRFVSADGKEIVAALWVSLIGTGPGRYALCHFQDVTQRKESEEALRASEQRYRLIIETTSEGVWLVDTEDRTTFVNQRLAEMLGYEVEDMLGMPLAPFVVGDPPDVRAKLEREHGPEPQHETRLRRRDGSALWVSISNDKLLDADGNYAGALAMVSDITERKRAAADLEEAKARFEGAFEHAPIGMAFVDLTADHFGGLLGVNEALCDLLGYTAEELRQLAFADVTHPADIESDRALAMRLVNGEVDSYQTDKRYIHKNGDEVLATLSASLVPDPSGTGTYAIAHVQDIRDRRRAEREVEEREHRFRGIFSHALDAMVIADDERNWLEGNKALAELTGVPQDEIALHRLDEFAAGDVGDTDEMWRQFLAAGEMKGDFDLRRADGEIRHVEFSARANFMPGRHLSIMRDVTERKRAEEAREQSRAEAERLEAALHQAQKLETVGQLAGGVAHDFNNLLAVIMHSSEFALTELAEHPAAEEVREIRAAADRAAALVRQLLVFSRSDIAQPRNLALNELVSSFRRLLRRTIGEHIVLEAVLDEHLPLVSADPNQIEQVLLNLAINARDAMPDGGTLRVETTVVELDEEYARLHADVSPGRYVRLAVSDTGEGMSHAVRQKAFEPFFTTKPKGMGTGLGLATTYGIVKQNDGHVEIYSEEDAGTVVKVYLPAVGGAAAVTDAEEPDAGAMGHGERVLLVEDEEAVRRVTQRILAGHGYNVVCAADPAEALELATGAELDLVVTDVVMPGMSGPMLLAQLRGNAPRLPAIFMSGYTDRPGVLPGDAAFLGKPFSRQALLTLVARALEHSRKAI